MKKAFCMLLLLGVLLFGLSGCKFMATGGGWIDSVIYGKKATFGFNVQLNPILDENGNMIPDPYNPYYPVVNVKGQFQYRDHGADYKFHGEFTDWFQPGDPSFPFYFSYPVFVGKTDDGLAFAVEIVDWSPERLTVLVYDPDDPFSGFFYYNRGYLRSGNIKPVLKE